MGKPGSYPLSCTWNEFQSLSICSECVNITSHIEHSGEDSERYQVSLPGGLSLAGFAGQINASVTNISSNLVGVEASVLQFSSLVWRSANTPPKINDRSVSAWECALYYCVNTYSAAVRDGILQQTVVSSWLNNSASLGQKSDLLYRPPLPPTSTITPDASEYYATHSAAKALNSFMSHTFNGSGGIQREGSEPVFSSDIIHALYETTNYSKRIENLATSMTNSLRQQNNGSLTVSHGLAYKSETFVHVRWAWLAYPIVIVVLSIVLLIYTIVDNNHRDLQVWKASILALMYHAQGLKLGDELHGSTITLGQMAGKSRDLSICLVNAGNGNWELLRADQA